MPPVYYAQIPTHNPDQNSNGHLVWLPFLLVHEVLFWLLDRGNILLKDMCSFPVRSGAAMNHKSLCQDLSLPCDKTAVIGMHGDGVSSHNKGSTEMISWNLPCLPGSERILFGCIEKKFLCRCGCLGRCTLNAMMSIFCWSIKILISVLFPIARHDGSKWLKSDGYRKNLNDHKNFGFFGALEQVRGDWMWLKAIFGFPGWSSKTSMCWRCQEDYHDIPFWGFSSRAKWKSKRHTHISFCENDDRPTWILRITSFRITWVCVMDDNHRRSPHVRSGRDPRNHWCNIL